MGNRKITLLVLWFLIVAASARISGPDLVEALLADVGANLEEDTGLSTTSQTTARAGETQIKAASTLPPSTSPNTENKNITGQEKQEEPQEKSSKHLPWNSDGPVQTWRVLVINMLAFFINAMGFFAVLFPAWQMVRAAVSARKKDDTTTLSDDDGDGDGEGNACKPAVPLGWLSGRDPSVDELLSLQERLFAQASKIPERIAAVDSYGKELRYGELVQRASMLATTLGQEGVKPDDLVGMFFPKSCGMLSGMAGILASGAAYVPIALNVPRARLESMLKDGNIRVVVVAASEADAANKKFGDLATVVVHDEDAALDGSTIRQPLRGKYAYTSFTSGSTGVPKGVLLSQRAVLTCVLRWPEVVGIDQNSTSMWSTTYTFDAGVTEYWPFLLVGAKLILPSSNALQDFNELEAIMESHAVSHCQFVPSVLTLFLHKHELPISVRSIALGGEGFPLPLRDAIFARSRCSDIKVLNIYAPTEVGVWVMHKHVSREEPLDGFAVIPVGKPLPHREVVVVDKTGALAPIGVRGEILMGGVGLAEGYVNDSKKTAEAFVDGVRARLQLPPFNLFGLGEETRMYRTGDYGRWLPNGDLEYLGRIDCQVKINGLRIELGEIENAIKSVGDSVKDAAVVAAGNILVAFSSGNANIRDLQEACRKKLPEYMVPKLYLTIEGEDGWPRTSSLKVDRKELVKRADEHIKNGPSKDTSIACSGSEAADGAGLDSLGMVRATMKIEAEEERLITNMKAVASFLIHAAHFFQQISKDFDGTDDYIGKSFYVTTQLKVAKHSPVLGDIWSIGDAADPLFIIALAFTDSLSLVGKRPNIKDAGLFIIWEEYLWVFPFFLQALSNQLDLEMGNVTWFLLMLVYCRIVLVTFEALRLPAPLQILLVLATWVVVCFTVEQTVPSSWASIGCQPECMPVGLGCVDHVCNADLPKGGVVETLGRIFINGSQQDELGAEFGYYAIYVKWFPMIAEYLFFFHYREQIMRAVRVSHRYISEKLRYDGLMLLLRIAVLLLFSIDWTNYWNSDAKFFNSSNLYHFRNVLNAMAMIPVLYECGLYMPRAGSNILGYFIVGYDLPPRVFEASKLFSLCAFVNDSLVGYPVQMLLGFAHVIGWMLTVGVLVTYCITSQFTLAAAGYHKAAAWIGASKTPGK